MRPKKKILLLSLSESRLSLLAFMLRTNGYSVTSESVIDEARELLATQPFDALLCDLPLPGVEELIASMHLINFWAKTLVIGTSTSDARLFADALFTFEPSAAELLERIKILCARKRGPQRKKLPERVPPVALTHAAEFLAARERLAGLA
jgi:CheY-like chemotaxis protein